MSFDFYKIIGLFGAPSQIGLLLCAFGLALCFTCFRERGLRFATAGAGMLVVMAFTPLGHFLSVPLETRFPEPPEDLPPPDGVIVLGGSVDLPLGGQLDRVVLTDSAERLTAPVGLLLRFPKARLVFTGGAAVVAHGSTFTEAGMAKRFWRDMGLDQDNVLYEDRSSNTYENAVYTRNLVKPKPGERWLLVTSAMHMPRAVGAFRRAGFPVISYPVNYRTNGSLWSVSMPSNKLRALQLVDEATHEWFGLAVYWLTAKTDTLFPAP